MTIPLEKEKTPTTNSRRPTLIQHWKELEKMVQPCASIKKKKKKSNPLENTSTCTKKIEPADSRWLCESSTLRNHGQRTQQ